MSTTAAASGKDFKTRYAELNAEQRAAVDATEGPVMVIAGPGTGKTEILTMRIANILGAGSAGAAAAKQTTQPEKILALTFTESGAVSMRRRLLELVGQDAYRVEISTFHGFANRVIREYPDYFPAIIGAVNITEIDQVRVLRTLIDTMPLRELKPFGERYFYLRNILRAINDLKQQGVSPDAFARIAAEEKTRFYANPDLINASGKYEGKMKTKYAAAANHVVRNLELADVYAEYQKALAAARQYDYSDMIMYVALALEKNEEMRRVLHDAYDYFLVDEHQDTNDAQNKMIELLAGGDGSDDDAAPNLFVVGDEKQAIFRFQGASLENFHYFSKRYQNVKLITLRNNYRSTQAILDAAQGVSPREAQLVSAGAGATTTTPAAVAKTVHAAKAARPSHAESPAHRAALASPDAEYFFIAQKIKELIEGGADAEEIVVLYRDNKEAAPLARVLEKEKVAFTIESDQDVLGDEEIKKLVRILRAVQHFGNDVWLAEALHVDFLCIPPIDAYKMMSFAAKQRGPGRKKLYDVLGSAVLLDEAKIETTASKTAALKLFANLSRWRTAAKNKGAAEAFEMIVRKSGFLAAMLAHPSATEKLAKLHALFDLLKSLVERDRAYTLDDFFSYLDLMEEHGVAVKGAAAARVAGRVRLMTAHRSKGQEFDYVFIMNAVDRTWGSRFRRESIKLPPAIYRVMADVAAADDDDVIDDDADERNVFYVALTRARKEVFVTLATRDREGRELLPTKFIAELAPNILAPYDTASYERAFAAHPELAFAPALARTPPELQDKAFLNALFEEQGISVTALNNYLECPWQYFYRNLIRIPEAPNKHLSFGNAIHAAFKKYFDAMGETGAKDESVAINAATTANGKVFLVARFEEALAREPIKEDEYEEALEKGRAALPAFYDEYHAGWAGVRGENEVKIDGVTAGGGNGKNAGAPVSINGKLDRVEEISARAAGGGGVAARAVRVIDYKTGKPKSRNEIEGNTKSADGNYKRQLVFYKLLLEKQGARDMQDGVIQFVEADDRGKFHREEFAVAHAEVAALEAEVARVAGEIRDLAFFNVGSCDRPDCKYCALRKGME